jgi:DNA ligase D-like protein (predicted 3'-phosphoesterase)
MSIRNKSDLKSYQSKRDFTRTAEPKNNQIKREKKTNKKFVIQKHEASHLHYDFRLQIGNVLASWAVPKGMPLKVGEKRLAIMTEDHPLSYATFEGTIPQGEYGGGTVMVWDHGTFKNIKKEKNKPVSLKQSLANGQIEVELAGSKLHGRFALIKYNKKEKNEENNKWLLIKMHDQPGTLRCQTNQRSALTGRTMSQIKKESSIKG